MVLDTDILIMGSVLDRYDLLGTCRQHRFATTTVNLDELVQDESKQPVIEAIAQNHIEVVSLDDPGEIEQFAALRRRAGKGEAAALAVAFSQATTFGTHDRKARSIAQSMKPPVSISDLESLLQAAMESNVLSRAEVEQMVQKLVQNNQHGVFSDGVPVLKKERDIHTTSSEV